MGGIRVQSISLQGVEATIFDECIYIFFIEYRLFSQGKTLRLFAGGTPIRFCSHLLEKDFIVLKFCCIFNRMVMDNKIKKYYSGETAEHNYPYIPV